VRIVHGIDELKTLVGQEAGVSDWVEVSQDRISRFADTTGDHQWIHVDVERARAESPYGTTIAHGFLTLALVSHLMSQAVRVEQRRKMGINYGLNRVRFPAPVPAGARVRGRFHLQKIEPIEGGVQITWNVTVEAEGASKPSLVAEWLVRYYQ
jgi:acyl dehydratase